MMEIKPARAAPLLVSLWPCPVTTADANIPRAQCRRASMPSPDAWPGRTTPPAPGARVCGLLSFPYLRPSCPIPASEMLHPSIRAQALLPWHTLPFEKEGRPHYPTACPLKAKEFPGLTLRTSPAPVSGPLR